MTSCEVTLLPLLSPPHAAATPRPWGLPRKLSTTAIYSFTASLATCTRARGCVAAPQLCDFRAHTPRSLRSHGAHACDARFTGFVMGGYDRFINRGLGEVVYSTSSMPYSVALSYPMPSLRSMWGFALSSVFDGGASKVHTKYNMPDTAHIHRRRWVLLRGMRVLQNSLTTKKKPHDATARSRRLGGRAIMSSSTSGGINAVMWGRSYKF